MKNYTKLYCSIFGFALLLTALPLAADEGMWLFDNFPRVTIQKKYGFTVTDAFLDHLRTSAVRFNNGGSGSFVSPNGLLFTNHHVGADCIQKLSSSENDYLKQGFHARNMDQERRCPDLELNVLLRTEDVTARVNEGVKQGVAVAEANRIRKASMSELEKACNSKTGNRCDVVTLFSGGQYHLYEYKKYTDIRLVFAPEFGIAFFGGDPDNFTYPRYNLDITFFRAYEDGKPARVAHYFRWSKTGVQDGELIFVPGNPGSTGRLATMAELQFLRDKAFPLNLLRLESLIRALESYSKTGEESRRIAGENLFSQQNSFKAISGFQRGLKDEELMAQKQRQETDFRKALAKDPARREEFAKFWDELSTAYGEYAKFYEAFYLLERNATRGSTLLEIARDVLRYAEETKKPNADRLREYTETALPSVEQSMYTTAPIHDSMEIAVLEDYFNVLQKVLGSSDVTVKAILNGRTPRKAAEHYVSSSKLKDVAERKRLAGDVNAVKASQDGMIQLARIIDPRARELRKQYEDRIEAVVNTSSGKIAQARFALSGGNEYPDATFTLRLAYGTVKGYKNDAGQPVPYATTLKGLYEKGNDTDPYIIPPSWHKAKSLLKLDTPFNFVSTADTHGGNSGSPTLDRKGEIVGILFDGNIEGLPNRFVFTDEQARSVHVASQGIVEALRKVYSADQLLKELGF